MTIDERMTNAALSKIARIKANITERAYNRIIAELIYRYPTGTINLQMIEDVTWATISTYSNDW